MAEIKRRSEAFSRVGSPQRMMAMSASDMTRLADLRIADVKPDPGNPRREFNQAELAELAASLKKHGLLQPIVVRKVENDYIILAGERRWRAAQLAEFISIKAIIHTESRTAANVLIAQIIENEQRAPLSTAELVASIERLLAEGMNVSQIATELAMSRTRVQKIKALTELPDELKPFLQTMGVDPLYEMVQRHKADPVSLQAAIETGKAPTRAALREAKKPVAPPAAESPSLPLVEPDEQKDGRSPGKVFAGEQTPGHVIPPNKSEAKVFAGEQDAPSPQKREAPPLPSYREKGSIKVRHADRGEGRVVYGMQAIGDCLPIVFDNADDPVQTPLTELTIVAID